MITVLVANKEQEQKKIILGKQCKNYFGKRWILSCFELQYCASISDTLCIEVDCSTWMVTWCCPGLSAADWKVWLFNWGTVIWVVADADECNPLALEHAKSEKKTNTLMKYRGWIGTQTPRSYYKISSLQLAASGRLLEKRGCMIIFDGLVNEFSSPVLKVLEVW